MREKGLAMLVSPSHCLICIPLQKRRKQGLGEVWVYQAPPQSSLSPPIHVKTSSPCQDGGSGGKEGAVDGPGPPGCAAGRAVPWASCGGATPSSCQCTQPPVQSSGLLGRCPSLPPPSLRLTSLHFLCQAPVSGSGRAARPLEGEEAPPSCSGYNWEGTWTCEEGRWGGAGHTLAPRSFRECSLVSHPLPGFSIDSGKGLVRAEELSFVAGAPRANHTGAVVILRKDSASRLVPEVTLFGERLTSGFGYSLAVADLNNDG